ncbi:ATP-binding cassette domain-containing protein [Gordonia sp. PKS22-38]|uniref:ATP-binding cassette domain-containing protein n=1 Tax=Gordonia prachuapensis TaxID=3115651 RepID=A0ABU7MPI6_9ACTN|nr:ATP-binding cassette domain-containing protein [Gordonia sp. PKS22-38]
MSAPEKAALTEAIVASGLEARFGARTIFSGIDVNVVPGRISGVVGPSGSGKTTLLRIVAGLAKPTAGQVDRPALQPAGGIGMLAQNPRQVCNPRWTLRRLVAEPATIGRRSCDVESIAERVGLEVSLLDRFPGQVSDGQLQRVCLGRLLVQAPRFVFCDEPTSMLDPVSARAVVAILQCLVDDGAGMMLVSHNRRLVERRCAEIVELGGSRVSGR